MARNGLERSHVWTTRHSRHAAAFPREAITDAAERPVSRLFGARASTTSIACERRDPGGVAPCLRDPTVDQAEA